MKYFFDTEFIENGKTIDLISIGVVCEDGREYYAINRTCHFGKADEWVKKNVLKPMGLDSGVLGTIQPRMSGKLTTKERLYLENEEYIRSKSVIKQEILDFLGWTEDGFKPGCFSEDYEITDLTFIPEFWADFCSYDWVVFCQLFERMIDLPEGFPMFCNDIQQLRSLKANKFGLQIILPEQEKGLHNALEDARHVKRQYDFLAGI